MKNKTFQEIIEEIKNVDQSKFDSVGEELRLVDELTDPEYLYEILDYLDTRFQENIKISYLLVHRVLGKGMVAASVPLLLELLRRYEDLDIKLKLIDALGEIGSNYGAEILINYAEHPDSRLRGAASWALGEIKWQRAKKVLIKNLEDEDAVVRRCATRALGNLGDKKVIPHIKKSLQKEKNKSTMEDMEKAIEYLESLY
ncbi:MAG: hypothetical protein A7316_02175 [Candidatus Altiarchaeales archaeon WOR_SM1_86-2]|nr:MAG: hypothetical protein A7316_02175 [Candidatus Altiarchaeales archaeon WOR_SM1_86-2]